MPRFVLPLRETGLELADIQPVLYRSGAASPVLLAQVTMVDQGSGYYRVTVPDGDGVLTWEYPEGVGSSYAWGSSGTPASLVLPLRTEGLVAADVEPKAFRDGAPQSLTFSLDPLELGDYALSGWPVEANGMGWAVTWTISGVTFQSSWWEVSAPRTDLSADQIEAIVDLRENGRPLTLRPPRGAVDFVTGESGSASLLADVQLYGLQKDYRSSQVNDRTILANDRMFLVAAGSFPRTAGVPGRGWVAYVGDDGVDDSFPDPSSPSVQRYDVIRLDKTVSEGSRPILWYLQVRS